MRLTPREHKECETLSDVARDRAIVERDLRRALKRIKELEAKIQRYEQAAKGRALMESWR